MLQQSQQGLYKIKTIAEITGLNATLLRAWERRYGLLHPHRTEKGHRLYTSEDLRVLSTVKSFISQGRSIGEVVALGRETLLAGRPDGLPSAAPVLVNEKSEATLNYGLERMGHHADLERLRHVAVQACLELDQLTLARVIDQAFSTASTAQCLEAFVTPAAREIGRLWAEDKASVAAEHLLTSLLARKLQSLLPSRPPDPSWPRALCACFPDESHELGAFIVNYHLVQRQVAVTYLGPSLPLEDLERAILLKKPQYAFLSATRSAIIEVHYQRFTELATRHKAQVTFIVGGCGLNATMASQFHALGIQTWPPSRPLGELTLPLSP